MVKYDAPIMLVFTLALLEFGNIHTQTTTEVFDSRPAWSPNGEKIAFVSRNGFDVKVNELYVMNVDGTGVQQLTSDGYYKKGVSWSPDGRWLAYAGGKDDQWHLFMIRSNGWNKTQLTAFDGHEPSWSPDGKKIIYNSSRNRDAELFTYDLATDTESKFETGRPNSWEPTWTKDNKILFISPLFTDIQEFYLIDMRNKDVEQITLNEIREFGGTFSPDQSQLAYAAQKNDNWDIYVLDLETKKECRLTFHADNDLFPDWSPNGKKLIFQSDRGPGRSIFSINADGTDLRKIDH